MDKQIIRNYIWFVGGTLVTPLLFSLAHVGAYYYPVLVNKILIVVFVVPYMITFKVKKKNKPFFYGLVMGMIACFLVLMYLYFILFTSRGCIL